MYLTYVCQLSIIPRYSFILQTAQQKAHLRCYYSSSNSDWLKVAPLKFQINSYDPFHITIKQLIFDHECDEITLNNIHLSGQVYADQLENDKLSWTDIRNMQKYV